MSVPSGIPCEPSGSAAGKSREPRHLWYKVSQNATWRWRQPKPKRTSRKYLKRGSSEAIRSRAESAGNAGLFDRHHEPPDQPRDFVQTVAVVIPHGLREANEALVVAHRRYFA